MLDFFDSLANVGDMEEETVNKLEQLTPIGYFNKIYEKYKRKNPTKGAVEFAEFVSPYLLENITFSATDDDAYYHKIDNGFYVKFNDKVTNVALYELEKRIDVTKYDAFHARFFGRVSELLLDVWINKNGLKYEEVKVMDMQNVNWWKKGTSFLKAKFTGKKYEKSF